MEAMRRQLGRMNVSVTLIAAFTGLLGLGGAISALTPRLAERAHVLRALYPPGVASAARDLVFVMSLCLIWLSLALARRRHGAWQVAVALVIVTIAGHLVKGLDVEEAGAGVLLLALLLRYRGQFDIPGDSNRARLTWATLAAGAAVVVWVGLNQEIIPGPSTIEWASGTLSLLLTLRALYFWLRPLTERVRESAIERRLAHEIVAESGTESLDFFALRRDKNYFFSPSRRSFLAYRVVAGAAVVSGDPIGETAEFEPLLAEFQRVARTRGWRLAILGGGAELAPICKRLGLRSIALGEEAIIVPEKFSLEGRPIRKVRQSVTRLTKAGHTFRVATATSLSASERTEIKRVSDEWRGNAPERGFTMAIDDLFAHPQLRFALAIAEDGRIGGFLHLVPSADGACLSLSSMRRRPGTPNGLTEFLIAQTVLWAKAEEIQEISLNFCVFKHFLEDDLTRLPHRAMRFLIRRLDHLFQIDRLLSFNQKFFPEWRPRYVFVERRSDIVLVGFAYMRLESLLVPSLPRRGTAENEALPTRSV